MTPRELFAAGYESIESRRLVEARAAFEATETLLPQSALAHVGLADVAFCEGDFDRAERHLRDGLEREPTSALARARLGEVLLFQGRAALGIQALRLASAADPDGAAGKHALAIIEAWRGGVLFRAGR